MRVRESVNRIFENHDNDENPGEPDQGGAGRGDALDLALGGQAGPCGAHKLKAVAGA